MHPTPKETLVLDVPCPTCQALVPAPFPYACPHCHSTFDGLVGKGTSAFQVKNSREHRDLLYGQPMKTIGITVKLQIQVDDEMAENMIQAPGFISLNGMCLG